MGLMGFVGLIGCLPINPILPIIPIAARPIASSTVHFFFDSAIILEIVFFPLDETTDEHITLMDKSDGNVGYGFITAVFDFLTINGRVKMSFAEGTGLTTSWVVLIPLL